MVAMLAQMSRGAMVLGTDYLTIKEASERSGYSAEYLRRLVRWGKIEARKIGTVNFVNVRSLDAYAEDKRNDGDGRTGPRSRDS